MSSGDLEAACEALGRWGRDPVVMARELFGAVPWDDGAPDSATTLLREAPWHDDVSITSGHKTSKSWTIALLALWFWLMVPGSRSVLLSPTARQVKRNLWKPLTELYARAAQRGMPLGGRLHIDPATGLVADPDHGSEIFGFATRNPLNFDGLSGPNVWLFVDEAAGVDEAVFEAIQGNRAGGSRLWLSGNATSLAGTFYRSHHSERELYRRFAFDSERVARWNGHDRTTCKVPGLATGKWVEAQRKRYRPHETHPGYLARVRGIFPGVSSRSVLDALDVLAAMQRHARGASDADMQCRLIAGLDVAREGDDRTCLAVRRGRFVYRLHVTAGLDGPQVALWALEQLRPYMTAHERDGHARKPLILVDAVGLGASAFDHGRRLKAPVAWAPVVTAEKADDVDLYHNLRAEAWFGVRQFLGEGGALPNDADLSADLRAPEFLFDNRDRFLVERKDRIKARLGRSPDAGDAVTLCLLGGEFDPMALELDRWAPYYDPML
jgi:phage terminase large subunit